MLTVEAIEVLNRCPVIVYPQTGEGTQKAGSLALDTVRQAVNLKEKTLVPVQFQMSRQTDPARDSYGELVKACTSYLDEGKDVAFISIGDVSLYSSAGPLMLCLKNLGYGVRAVAGVNAFSAAACAAVLDMAEKDSALTIIPGDAYYKSGMLDAALSLPGAKILMKMNRHLKDCVDSVARAGLLERSTLVQHCSLPAERMISGSALLDLPEDSLSASYLSVVIICG